MLLSVIQKVASIASSGNLTVTIPFAYQVPAAITEFAPINRMEVRVSAIYAAVAGTSGINVQLSYSLDGSTYTNIGPVLAVSPAATALGSVAGMVGDIAQLGRVVSVKALITNTDATNVVEVVVDSMAHRGEYAA